MSYTADPNDKHMIVSDDHSLLSLRNTKAVRQPNAFTRGVAEEVLSIPADKLISIAGLYEPFFNAANAPAKLLEALPAEYLQQCAKLQQSFLQIESSSPVQIAFFYDLGNAKPKARPFHIEQRFCGQKREPIEIVRARQLIASFSDASMGLTSGGETEMVFTDKLSKEQILSTLGNADPLGSPSLEGITTGSLDACEAVSFWGSSIEYQNPYTDYLIHRSRPVGSKRLSFGITANHVMEGFDI